MAWLHFHGKSDLWPVKSDHERALKAALWVLEVHAKQFRQNRNRLEAMTARHWPELTLQLDLDSATLLELLMAFGGPAGVAARPTDARALMRRVGGSPCVRVVVTHRIHQLWGGKRDDNDNRTSVLG